MIADIQGVIKMRKNLTGMIFGNWKVISVSHFDKRGNTYWNCECICGNLRKVRSTSLSRGTTLSCKSCSNKTHGLTKNKHFSRWKHMMNRCFNKNDDRYNDYGGRGIVVCKEWQDPKIFIDWCDATYLGQEYTLDRFPNKNGPYSPENCRWATSTQQQRNRRNNVYLKDGTLLVEFAARIGIRRQTAYSQYKRGKLI